MSILGFSSGRSSQAGARFVARFPMPAHSKGGFTLIELLVSAGIAIMIFGMGFTLLRGIRLGQTDAMVKARATESANQFFRMVERDLSMAFPGPFSELNEKAELRFDLPAYDPTKKIPPFLGVGLQMTTSNIDFSDAQIGEFVSAYEATTGEKLDLNVGLAHSSVRYYVIMHRLDGKYNDNNLEGDTGLLYREVSLVQSPPLKLWMTADPPYTFENALFENVNTLAVSYFQWETDTKKMTELTEDKYHLATHLNVTIGFLDPNTRLQLSQRKRTFNKLFPIPKSFKN